MRYASESEAIKLRIFIIGPDDTRLNLHNYLRADFDYIEIINPARLSELTKILSIEEMLNLEFKLIDMCEYVYMLNDWQQSTGANRLYGYAIGCEKTIFSQTQFDKKTSDLTS